MCLSKKENECRYEFSVHPEDRSFVRQSISHWLKITGDPPRIHLGQGFENITHDGCVILDSAEDLEVEFSLLLISVDARGWIEDEDFDIPDEHALSSNDQLAVAFEALAVVATGGVNEYRRIGFADIHDRRFFAGTQDIEINLI